MWLYIRYKATIGLEFTDQKLYSSHFFFYEKYASKSQFQTIVRAIYDFFPSFKTLRFFIIYFFQSSVFFKTKDTSVDQWTDASTHADTHMFAHTDAHLVL